MPRIRAESITAHKTLTRRQVLDAAAELFLEQGYGATSLADIAAEVGIGRTTLYEYFPDKEAVLITLVEETLPAVVDGIVDGLPEGLTARERLGELLLRHLEFVSNQDNLGTLLMREGASLSPRAQAAIAAVHRRLTEAIRQTCVRGADTGEFRDVSPDATAELVNALVMAAARQLLRSPEPKADFHTVGDTMLGLLFDGLVAD